MSLRSRLIISYIVIIVVCLLLAFVTLILVARPIQNRLAAVRLGVQSRQAALRLDQLYAQNSSTEEVLNQFKRWSARAEAHLLLVDPQLNVLADSQGDWTGQHLNLATIGAGTTGLFRGPDGDRLNYAATPVGAGGNQAGYVVAVSPRSPVLNGVLADLGWGFVVAGTVALLLSLLLGLVIARSMARPLQQISTAAGAVAAGNYQHRLAETGPPEIKRVAASFNLMIERVENSQQAMRDFVSNVSHELKTPLTSIQGFSQAIMEGATPDEPARRRAATIITQEAGRLSRLVEDLLDLARIDSGQVVMRKTLLDLNQLLTGTIDRLLPQAAAQQVTLVKQWAGLPPILGDGDRLAQVFTNFLDNAVRYTPPGGRITVSGSIARNLPRPHRVRAGLFQPDATTTVSERGDFVEICVADTGPGMPAAELARIFERFYQVDKSRKRGQGTGLGLAIAKEIVEAHGGAIRAESLEGVGTKFTVLLPVSEAEALTQVSPRQQADRRKYREKS